MRTKPMVQLLMETLDRDMFTSDETKRLVEIAQLESELNFELLNMKVKEFKSHKALDENDWLDFYDNDRISVSIDFDEEENLTITEESKNILRFDIKGLGTFKISKKSLDDGLWELRNLNPGTKSFKNEGTIIIHRDEDANI